MKKWHLLLLVGLLGACNEDSSTTVEVEVETSTAAPAPPFMGKNREFYEGNADAFDLMRAWCKEHVDSVRTRAQSMECATVGGVYRSGGPLSRRPKLRTLNSNVQLPPIPDAPDKSTN